MSAPPAIVWFRNDLRTTDHPALAAAAHAGGPVVPVFVWDPASEGVWPCGAASKWWLHRSLACLGDRLAHAGSRLILRVGDTAAELCAVARETGATRLHFTARVEPAAIACEERVVDALAHAGVQAAPFGGALLHDPRSVRTQGGHAYKVFTPFWKTVSAAIDAGLPAPAPHRLVPPTVWPASVSLGALALEPSGAWGAGLRDAWVPGELAAQKRLAAFAAQAVHAYAARRDTPGEEGTSRLSPHLHFGEISPRQVWHVLAAARRAATSTAADDDEAGITVFAKEIGWREFAHHVMANYPRTAEHPLRPEFERFPWQTAPMLLRAWQQGRTGYPLVDAGMRQLWATGWMHNRVRMVVASFLVKHLLVDWREGARWFWNTLVDADLANNTLGWQWAGGCGADAAPYFRVFNPVLQGQKFDPQGAYTRRWVPELARLAAVHLHAPWCAPAEALRAAGIDLGRTYPRPVVDHAHARARALHALSMVTAHNASG